MLESLILYLKGMRIMMFQLSGIHYRTIISLFNKQNIFEMNNNHQQYINNSKGYQNLGSCRHRA